jgi:hypothetical protein
MDAGTRELVRLRAGNRCEYCRLQQEHSGSTHQLEHVVARQHGGRDSADNLALACDRCNLRKGPNLSGIDPVSGVLVALFNPRRDVWAEHFRFHGAHIEGLTPAGRAIVQVPDMNHPGRVRLRSALLCELN